VGENTAVARFTGIVPTNLDDLYRMAKMIALSGLAPKALNRPESIATAIQMGAEVGLTPMQAMQSICVINGRPSIWGDGALGLVHASGLMEEFEETFIEKDGQIIGARCRAVRKGLKTPIVREFTEADAGPAGLLTKEGPWQTYRPRMYQMRARSWCLRDGFADVLKGLRVAEEEQDIIPTDYTTVDEEPKASPLTEGRKSLKKPEPEKVPEAPPVSEPEPPPPSQEAVNTETGEVLPPQEEASQEPPAPAPAWDGKEPLPLDATFEYVKTAGSDETNLNEILDLAAAVGASNSAVVGQPHIFALLSYCKRVGVPPATAKKWPPYYQVKSIADLTAEQCQTIVLSARKHFGE
jgi:hypothetical protein